MKPTVKISVKNAETIKKLATLAKPAEKGTAFKVGIIDDPEVATYAAYNEFGWVQRVTPKQSVYLSGRLNYSVKKNGFANAPIKPGMTLSSPPRPFLRGTADAKKEDWRDLIAQGIKTIGVQRQRSLSWLRDRLRWMFKKPSRTTERTSRSFRTGVR